MQKERGLVEFEKKIYVISFSAVCGEMEDEGPLKGKFDHVFKGDSNGKKSFEQAESEMQLTAAKIALRKAVKKSEEIDIVFAGDLLNQIVGSTYGLKCLKIPIVGLFGACATFAEAIAVGSVFLNSNSIETAMAVTSSHNCAAERQFRCPIEYGGQKPLTAQWTATAAGALILGLENSLEIRVRAVCFGEIVDFDVKDMSNMGAAMAPAAASTLLKFFNGTRKKPEDFDLILTGDLGKVGSAILVDLMEKEGIQIKNLHEDCGKLIYDFEKQPVNSGGSGSGCSAAVVCSEILKKMQDATLKNVVFAATGALMSTTTNQQGESIPGICHAIWFERED